jgi:hypothetical protein
MQGINDYFKDFKSDDNGKNSEGTSLSYGKNLPSIETIISESLKIKISEEYMSELKL